MPRVVEGVGGEVLCHVVHKTLVVHRACAAVGVEDDGVGIGDEGAHRDVACLHAADGDGAAGATIARTNSVVAALSFCGGDAGHAVGDGDVAARGIVVSAADACGTGAASGRNSAAADGDVAARALPSAAYTCSTVIAIGRNGAPTDDDIAARVPPTATDARATVTARGVERAAALDGEGLVGSYVDAGTATSSLHAVGRASIQDDGGVAQAADARPRVAAVVGDGGVVHAVEGHRGAVGDGDLGLGAARAGEDVAVTERHVSASRGQRHHIGSRGGGEVHVDVGTARTTVQVVAGAAAVCAYGTALGGVEGDGGDAGVVRQGVLGVVEEDVVAA